MLVCLLLRPHSTGPASSKPAQRSSSTSSIVAISSRASDAPRQWWMPWPNARCGLGSRPTSKRSGSANTGLVAVRGRVPVRRLLAGPDRDAAELDVPGRGPAVVGGRARPPQDLLDRGRAQRTVGAQPVPLPRPLGEGEHSSRDRVAGRLAAGGEQQAEERAELGVGEPALDHGRQQVVGRVAPASRPPAPRRRRASRCRRPRGRRTPRRGRGRGSRGSSTSRRTAGGDRPAAPP